MASYVYNSSTDKVVSLIADKVETTSLNGKKDLDAALIGNTDKTIQLLGDSLLSFTTPSDKVVSLLGSVDVSLIGRKTLDSTLMGELSTTVSLVGEAPFSWFHIYCDTTYKYCDSGDITCDRD